MRWGASAHCCRCSPGGCRSRTEKVTVGRAKVTRNKTCPCFLSFVRSLPCRVPTDGHRNGWVLGSRKLLSFFLGLSSGECGQLSLAYYVQLLAPVACRCRSCVCRLVLVRTYVRTPTDDGCLSWFTRRVLRACLRYATLRMQRKKI